MSFNEIVETLNRRAHHFSYKQVPKENFAGSFPGATEIAETLLGSSYLSGFRFVRSNYSRKQSSRPGTDPVFDLGWGEFSQTAQRH